MWGGSERWGQRKQEILREGEDVRGEEEMREVEDEGQWWGTTGWEVLRLRSGE